MPLVTIKIGSIYHNNSPVKADIWYYNYGKKKPVEPVEPNKNPNGEVNTNLPEGGLALCRKKSYFVDFPCKNQHISHAFIEHFCYAFYLKKYSFLILTP